MRRALAVLALLLFASPLCAQANGRGLIKPQPSDRLSLVPSDQYSTVTYTFTSVPSTTANSGLLVKQSTAAGVTFNAISPLLEILAPTTSRRASVGEPYYSTVSCGAGLSSTGDVTASFTLSDQGGVTLGANSWFQFGVGDSSNFKTAMTGTSGLSSFGIIIAGTAAGNAAYAPNGKVTAYVVDGAGDSTYKSMDGLSYVNPVKFWMHADAGSGAVSFWANDVLYATIAAPARTAGCWGWTAWLSGDTATPQDIALGPVTIQRAMP